MKVVLKAIVSLVVIIGLVWVGWLVFQRLQVLKEEPEEQRRSRGPAPVEVAAVEVGTIEQRRTFSGTLEARASTIVAPKVSGRIETLTLDIADSVSRGQVVAELDRAEFAQSVLQAEAEVAVTRSTLASARSALEIADRELKRAEALFERGVTSEAQLDAGRADRLARQAEVDVAEAELQRAEVAVEAARIRLGYTTVAVTWNEGGDSRVVAERFANEGDTVSANTPLLSVVQLHPIQGVIFATERDYGRLSVGQEVELTTDAYAGEIFRGTIERISPVFQQGSRQARVELRIDNADLRLKPGMFIRATVVLQRLSDVMIVPELALANRDDVDGVFVVSDEGTSVRWQPVTLGVRDGDRVQVIAEGLAGDVVTLGQQLVDDGSAITIPHRREVAEPPP